MKIKDTLSTEKLDSMRRGIFGYLDKEMLDEELLNSEELSITEYAMLRIAQELTLTRNCLERMEENQ